MKKLKSIPTVNRYMTDAVFRNSVSLYASLAINLLYVALNVLSYFLYCSMWFTVLAVYYGTLALMRFLLLKYEIGVNLLGELKRAVLCSSVLLTVNFALSGAVLMMMYQDKGFEYHGVLIYAVAAYTFYMTVRAIINMVKYRKYNSPVMMTSKVISLCAALVSMLALETAMFSQFGQNMAKEDQTLMIALTGAGVSIAVVTMSLYMIIHSYKEIKKFEEK